MMMGGGLFMTNTISRVAGLVAGIMLLTMVVPAGAQVRAQQNIITQLLWQSLQNCYISPIETVEDDDEIVLRTELNKYGDLADLPSLISSDPLTSGERALLRQATVALINCTPITSGGGDKSIYGTFNMVINQQGLLLTDVDARVGSAAPTLETLPAQAEEPVQQAAPAEAPEPVAEAPASNTPELGTKSSEALMGLTREDRNEIQRRLTLMNYDTRGVDGTFGPGSRGALKAWQRDSGIPISGFLNLNQLAFMREQSQDLYTEWQNRPKRYVDRNGCLREANGQIIQNRSFKCDIAATSQNLGISR